MANTTYFSVPGSLKFTVTQAMSDLRLARPQDELLNNVYKGLVCYDTTNNKLYVYTGNTAERGEAGYLKEISFGDEALEASPLNFIGTLGSTDVVPFANNLNIQVGLLVTKQTNNMTDLYYCVSTHAAGDWNDLQFHKVNQNDMVKASAQLTIPAANNGAANAEAVIAEGSLLIFTLVGDNTWKVIDFGVNLSNYVKLSDAIPTGQTEEASAALLDSYTNPNNIRLIFRSDIDLKYYVYPGTLTELITKSGIFASAQHTHDFETSESSYITYSPDTFFNKHLLTFKLFTPTKADAEDYITEGGVREYCNFDAPIYVIGHPTQESAKLNSIKNLVPIICDNWNSSDFGDIIDFYTTDALSIEDVIAADFFKSNDNKFYFVNLSTETCFSLILGELGTTYTINDTQYYFKFVKGNLLSQSHMYIVPLVKDATMSDEPDNILREINKFENKLEALGEIVDGTKFTLKIGNTCFLYTAMGYDSLTLTATFHVEEFSVA